MKKLMLTLAAIATATVVNAAACAWSGAGVTLQTGDVATQYTMYLLDASVTSASDMATYLSAGDTSKLAAATVQTTTGIAVGTTAARWNSSFGRKTVLLRRQEQTGRSWSPANRLTVRRSSGTWRQFPG